MAKVIPAKAVTVEGRRPYLFQQVIIDVPTYGVSLEIKVDVHVLPKPAGIVVAVCFGVAKGLQHTVGFQQDVLHPAAGMDGKGSRIRLQHSHHRIFFPQPFLRRIQ